MSEPIAVTREGLSLAGLAFMEAPGTNNRKVEEAIAAYLWAEQNTVDLGFGIAYPSLADTREFLTDYRRRRAAAITDREDHS